MSAPKTQEQVFSYVLPLVEAKGLELVAVEYVKEGGNWYLRIYIDKEGGVDLDDCQGVSTEVSDLLDKKDPIPQSYFLEVSSPGIERLLQSDKDFARFRGRAVTVHTYAPVDGKKKLKGNLGSADQEEIELLIGAQAIRIPREKVSQVRLAWEEEEGKKKK
ncbi:MAG: ribosome maturation factor RimP [Clostridia bacterium]|jgi:ribosome maturation factor RimP|nr:ribosome maturation factor RimP [Clostridia bacterium]